jgi:hypothetical protein
MFFHPISEGFGFCPVEEVGKTHSSRIDLTSSFDALFLDSPVLSVSDGLVEGLEDSAGSADFWTALMVSMNVF